MQDIQEMVVCERVDADTVDSLAPIRRMENIKSLVALFGGLCFQETNVIEMLFIELSDERLRNICCRNQGNDLRQHNKGLWELITYELLGECDRLQLRWCNCVN